MNQSLSGQRKEIEEKLQEQQTIRQRKQVIQSIIDIQKSIQQLKELDDAINLSKYFTNVFHHLITKTFSLESISVK